METPQNLTQAPKGVLEIPADIYEENYNLDITEFIDRHTFKEKSQKGASIINYMSHASATRIFRMRHPNLQVVMVENPKTGGYVHEEIGGRGYFLKGYITDGTCDSETIYFAVLGSSGNSVLPDDVDRNGSPIASSKAFNTAFARAKAKIIASVTGIGWKLWTGDDLDEDIKDEKIKYLKAIDQLAEKYLEVTGVPYNVTVSILDTQDVIKAQGSAIKRAITEAEKNDYIDVDSTIKDDVPLEGKEDTAQPSLPEASSRKALKASKV